MKRFLKWGVPAAALSLILAAGLIPNSVSAVSAVPKSETTFTFTDSGITASGESGGWKIDGTTLKITEGGVYTITGSCGDGSVQVNKETTDVTLVLNDLTLESSDSAPLSCNKNSGVTLYVQGAVTLTDGEDPAEEATSDAADAADFDGAVIKVKSGAALTVTGSGTLTLDGSACKNGIKGGTASEITIDGAEVNVTAANTGIASDNQVIINGGTVNVDAENDGIKASPDEADTESLGNITVTGGTVTVTAGDDALHADGNLLISGGTFTVSAGDDAFHADYDLTIEDGNITVAESYEGLEGSNIFLNGGSAVINSSDDGVNAANKTLRGNAFEITVNGGQWTVNAGGDGLDANGSITVNGGTTIVYGAENARGGNTAIDCDGSFTWNGGTLLTLDYPGMGVSLSGTSVTFGSTSGMTGGMMGGNRMGGGMMGGPEGFGGQLPGRGTEQNGRVDSGDRMPAEEGTQSARGERPDGQERAQDRSTGNADALVSKGSTVKIVDDSGRTLITATALKSASRVMLWSDALTAGDSYTLYVDGAESGSAEAATVTASRMPGQMQGRGMNGRMDMWEDGAERSDSEEQAEEQTQGKGSGMGQDRSPEPDRGQLQEQGPMMGQCPMQGQRPMRGQRQMWGQMPAQDFGQSF